jgi:hypothetical protein
MLRRLERCLGSGFLLVALIGLCDASPMTGDVAAAREPYRRERFALADLSRAELPWTREPPLRLPARRPRDERGIPLFPWHDGKLYYRPGALAINGMKRIDAFIETGDQAQLDQALLQAWQLRRMSLHRRRAAWLPFWFDYLPAGQRAPWVNAMSQGLALSFYVRLYALTGDSLHMDAARQVLRSFRRFGQRGTWVAYIDERRHLWLEHYPRRRPDHVLNAHLHAIVGLYEYWQETRSRFARRLLEGAITTMRDQAWRYRNPGSLSFYGLRTRSTIRKYHEIHVWQLRLLRRISGDRYFWRLANRLARDERPFGYVPGKPSVMGQWDGSQSESIVATPPEPVESIVATPPEPVVSA